MASSPALAATSQTTVYHWSGARPVAGKVWFNSGTHNPAKGRNSFTVKDSMCGDGWAIFALYRIGDGPLRQTRNVSCDEFSVSVAGNVARTRITWWGCKASQNDPVDECESSKSDWVD